MTVAALRRMLDTYKYLFHSWATFMLSSNLRNTNLDRTTSDCKTWFGQCHYASAFSPHSRMGRYNRSIQYTRLVGRQIKKVSSTVITSGSAINNITFQSSVISCPLSEARWGNVTHDNMW